VNRNASKTFEKFWQYSYYKPNQGALLQTLRLLVSDEVRVERAEPCRTHMGYVLSSAMCMICDSLCCGIQARAHLPCGSDAASTHIRSADNTNRTMILVLEDIGLRKGGTHLLETACFSPVRQRSPPTWNPADLFDD
jgi:hypothetical protein